MLFRRRDDRDVEGDRRCLQIDFVPSSMRPFSAERRCIVVAEGKEEEGGGEKGREGEEEEGGGEKEEGGEIFGKVLHGETFPMPYQFLS